MVKRKRQQPKYDTNISYETDSFQNHQDSSFLNEQQENISDIFNKLSFDDLKDSENIDDLIINFTKKIHVSSTQSSTFVDTRSMQLRAELQQLRKFLMAHYKDIETVNWMSHIIIDEIKSQKLKELSATISDTSPQRGPESQLDVPTVKDLEHQEFIDNFVQQLEEEDFLNAFDYE
jgi:hypothetical protein